MTLLKLTPRTRRILEDIICHPVDARQLRRAQALLWLAAGESVSEVAQRLHCSRQGVYKVIHTFQTRRDRPLAERLLDLPRSGRPADRRLAIEHLIQAVMATSPRAFGCSALAWTAPLLRAHLRRTDHLEVSERTVRRRLRDLGYRYKGPRYVLGRRSPHWRQAKGGSKTGSNSASARSFCSATPPS